jgi:DNA polymerase III subunit epsilon
VFGGGTLCYGHVMSPIDFERLAQQLEGSDDYRVLRRLKPAAHLDRATLPAGAREGLALDLETTGLQHGRDRPIEVGLVRFAYNEAGVILGVTGELSALEDPGFPLEPIITRITGIEDADLAGQRFPDDAVARLIEGVVLVVAHNAEFDRPFAEERWPALQALHWACSLKEIDWSAFDGYVGQSLGALLMARGYFFGAHRAVTDAHALTQLLRIPVGDDQIPFNLLRASARRTTVRLWADRAPFEQKDLLKARGYRWNGEARLWWTDVDEEELEAELAYLEREVYRGRMGRLPQQRIDARQRWSRRVLSAP